MTVAELIEELKKYPQEAEVVIYDDGYQLYDTSLNIRKEKLREGKYGLEWASQPDKGNDFAVMGDC